VRNSYYLVVVGEFKIPITIRKAGTNFKSISGADLVKKVTRRAIGRFLSDVLQVPYRLYDPKNVEYQAVFCRDSSNERSLSSLRVRNSGQNKFIIVAVNQIHNIGISESQFLRYLRNNSFRVKPAPGELSI